MHRDGQEQMETCLAVARHAHCGLAYHFQCSHKESFGRVHIALLSQHGIDQVALPVNRAVEVLPLPSDADVGFVDVPGTTGLSLALGAKVVGHKRREVGFPLAHGFMGEHKAALQEHVGEIAQTELVAEAPEDDQQHDAGRKLKIVVGRARALVELALAGATANGSLAELGALRQVSGCCADAARTGHLVLPGKLDSGHQDTGGVEVHRRRN